MTTAMGTPVPTVAGIRATLLDAAQILEDHGWAQGQLCTAEGRVCATAAITLAAAGQGLDAWFAVYEVERVLGLGRPFGSDLAGWQDVPGRTVGDVTRLLRNVARLMIPVQVAS